MSNDALYLRSNPNEEGNVTVNGRRKPGWRRQALSEWRYSAVGALILALLHVVIDVETGLIGATSAQNCIAGPTRSSLSSTMLHSVRVLVR